MKDFSTKSSSSVLGAREQKVVKDVGFRFDEDMVDDEMLVFGTQTGSIVFAQPGPKPKILATHKDSHEGRIDDIVYSESMGRLISFGMNEEDDKCEMKVRSERAREASAKENFERA